MPPMMRSLEHRLPSINFQALPVEEHGPAAELLDICRQMISFAEQLEGAVTLYAVVKATETPDDPFQQSRWAFVCARDGAMSLYHIGFLHEKLRASFKDCPAVREQSDHPAIREAGRAFRDAFPAYEELRHSIGHAAEIGATKQARARNAMKEDFELPRAVLIGAGAFTRNILINDNFSQTINGKTVGYDVTVATLEVVKRILENTFNALRANGPAKADQG